MRLMGSSCCLFLVVLLADVAPSPSGCRSSEPSTGYIHVQASDCSCAGGEIVVEVDGQVRATITCGAEGGQAIELPTGRHSVSASSGPLTWTTRSYNVSGSPLLVDLGCPGE